MMTCVAKVECFSFTENESDKNPGHGRNESSIHCFLVSLGFPSAVDTQHSSKIYITKRPAVMFCLHQPLLSFLVSRCPQSLWFSWFSPPPPAWCFFPNAAVNSKQLSGRSFETKRGLFHCSCIVTVGLQLPSLATNRVYITRKQMTYRKWAEKHHVFFFFRGVVVYWGRAA